MHWLKWLLVVVKLLCMGSHTCGNSVVRVGPSLSVHMHTNITLVIAKERMRSHAHYLGCAGISCAVCDQKTKAEQPTLKGPGENWELTCKMHTCMCIITCMHTAQRLHTNVDQYMYFSCSYNINVILALIMRHMCLSTEEQTLGVYAEHLYYIIHTCDIYVNTCV